MDTVLREMLLQGELHAHDPARRLVWLDAVPCLLQVQPLNISTRNAGLFCKIGLLWTAGMKAVCPWRGAPGCSAAGAQRAHA